MTDVRRRLELARDEVARLERALAAASCAEAGHDWVYMGGRNCGCFPGADCSVPVHECSRCGDCDYGENEDAEMQVASCPAAEEYAEATTREGMEGGSVMDGVLPGPAAGGVRSAEDGALR